MSNSLHVPRAGVCRITPLSEYWLIEWREIYTVVCHSVVTELDGILYKGKSPQSAWELFNELTDSRV